MLKHVHFLSFPLCLHLLNSQGVFSSLFAPRVFWGCEQCMGGVWAISSCWEAYADVFLQPVLYIYSLTCIFLFYLFLCCLRSHYGGALEMSVIAKTNSNVSFWANQRAAFSVNQSWWGGKFDTFGTSWRLEWHHSWLGCTKMVKHGHYRCVLSCSSRNSSLQMMQCS